MSEEVPEKTADKRPFSKFYRDIGVNLRGDATCLAMYSTILTEVSWGEHKKRKRRVHEVKPGQFLTSVRDLQKLTGMHKTTVQNSINTLGEMGIIAIQLFPNVGMCITVINKCTKDVHEAMKIIQMAGNWQTSKPYTATGRRPTKRSSGSIPTHYLEKYRVDSDPLPDKQWVDSDPLPDKQWVDSDPLTPFPSFVLGEEESNKNNNKERTQKPDPSPLEPDTSDGYNFSDLDFEEETPPRESSPYDLPLDHANSKEPLETVRNLPPTRENEEAKPWLDLIHQAYPRAKCELLDLIKIIREGRKILETARIPPDDFLLVVSYVWNRGNDFQKAKFFKNPKEILKQDDFGTTPLEEMCLSFKTYFKKAERKLQRHY